MSLTVNKIMAKVRRGLHDPTGVRWDDDILVGYINDAQYDLFRKRPEYWLGSYDSEPLLILADKTSLDADLIMPDEILENISAFVSSLCLGEDDSDTENLQRAQIFLSKYEKITR